MISDEIPDFCGGQQLFGFPDSALTSSHSAAKETKIFLVDQIAEWKHRRCMLMAVLNEEQRKQLHKVFTELKFKAVATSLNPNTANKCTLYVYKYAHRKKRVLEDLQDFDY